MFCTQSTDISGTSHFYLLFKLKKGKNRDITDIFQVMMCIYCTSKAKDISLIYSS